MFDILDDVLGVALRETDQAEVEIYGERSSMINLDLEKGIKNIKTLENNGIGIRVICDKSQGFSYTSDLSQVDKCVKNAIKHAKASKPDPNLRLPSPKSYHHPKGTFDENLVDLDYSDVISHAQAMTSAATEYSSKVEPTGGSFSVGWSETYVMNSEGIEISDKGTYVAAGVSVVVASENISASESDAKRSLRDIDPTWIGEESAKLAMDSRRPISAKTNEMPAIFTPKALENLLVHTTIPQLSAENVRRNRSPYVDRMSTKVGSDLISVLDDGTLNSGLCTSKMDGEGTPTQRTSLIKNGILNSFMYDSYSATLDKTESTGNAVRNYDCLPTIGATNFVIENGNVKREEMEEIPSCILVTDVIGAHTASKVSGRFSVVVHNGFEISHGDKKPIKGVIISDNMPDLLLKIDAVANDVRQVGSVISPSIRISEVQIVG